MTTSISVLIVAIVLCVAIDKHCQAWNSTDSAENQTEIVPSKAFVYHGRHYRRVRRQNGGDSFNPDTASTVLSILPFDRIGTIVGQIMSTGLKEMLNPEVGKKLVNVLENQAPLLLTSLFTNLYSTLGVASRPASSTTNLTLTKNSNAVKPLSNSTNSQLINALRSSPTK